MQGKNEVLFKLEGEARTEACFVAYLIPIAKYRKRILLEILMRRGG